MLALPKNIRIMPSHSFDVNAGIAQLVEHDLAKVGVAKFEPRFPLQIHNPSPLRGIFFMA